MNAEASEGMRVRVAQHPVDPSILGRTGRVVGLSRVLCGWPVVQRDGDPPSRCYTLNPESLEIVGGSCS
jgi:hypothetical protein